MVWWRLRHITNQFNEKNICMIIVFEKLHFTEQRWLFLVAQVLFLVFDYAGDLLVFCTTWWRCIFCGSSVWEGKRKLFLFSTVLWVEAGIHSYKNRRNSGIVLSVGFCAILLNIVFSDVSTKNNATMSCSILTACSLLTLIFLFHLQVSWSGDTWQNFFGQCGIWSHEGKTWGGRQNCRFVLVPAFVVCQWDKQMH